MEDLLLGLLWVLVEFLGEALLEFLPAFILDVIWRSLKTVFGVEEPRNPALATIGYATLGILVGAFSLLVMPHPLVRPSRFHGISLLLSPMGAGLMMALVGSVLRWRDQTVTQFESFGYGFTFAFGMALMRFFFAK